MERKKERGCRIIWSYSERERKKEIEGEKERQKVQDNIEFNI